jgi:hypothetical protein
MRALVRAAALAGSAAAGYRLLVSGRLALDLDWGRTMRPLGPILLDVAAPREVVFDVIAGPYLEKTPRSVADRLDVLERGSDMVLAAFHSPVRQNLVANTLEIVRFQRPDRIDLRLVRGPVPYVVEHVLLSERDGGTRIEYRGELGADLWLVGRWWGGLVARTWERNVRSLYETARVYAERRAAAGADVASRSGAERGSPGG